MEHEIWTHQCASLVTIGFMPEDLLLAACHHSLAIFRHVIKKNIVEIARLWDSSSVYTLVRKSCTTAHLQYMIFGSIAILLQYIFLSTLALGLKQRLRIFC